MYVFVCAVFQQGSHLFIGSLSGRFVFLTTFVATLALFNIIFGLGSILLLVLGAVVGDDGIVVVTVSVQREFKWIDSHVERPLTLAWLKNSRQSRKIFGDGERENEMNEKMVRRDLSIFDGNQTDLRHHHLLLLLLLLYQFVYFYFCISMWWENQPNPMHTQTHKRTHNKVRIKSQPMMLSTKSFRSFSIYSIFAFFLLMPQVLTTIPYLSVRAIPSSEDKYVSNRIGKVPIEWNEIVSCANEYNHRNHSTHTLTNTPNRNNRLKTRFNNWLSNSMRSMPISISIFTVCTK